jgi:hypothetical protein
LADRSPRWWLHPLPPSAIAALLRALWRRDAIATLSAAVDCGSDCTGQCRAGGLLTARALLLTAPS